VDLKDFRHRNFPAYTIWGVFIAAAGIVSMVSYGSWTGVPVFAVFTVVGLLMMWRGWVVSGERPRRG
jgi:hypothetical protein